MAMKKIRRSRLEIDMMGEVLLSLFLSEGVICR
jgi:hypothetical protein